MYRKDLYLNKSILILNKKTELIWKGNQLYRYHLLLIKQNKIVL